MKELMNRNFGLPADFSQAQCSGLLLKPFDVDDLMHKFYDTPWNYDAPYLHGSKLYEVFEIFRKYMQIEFGDWTYHFVPFSPMGQDVLNLDILATKENFMGCIRVIKDRYLHPFQYPITDGINDHADHFGRMLTEANRVITQWNQICTNKKPIIYERPKFAEFKELLLDSFFNNAIMNEWNTGMGIEFDDFDEFMMHSWFGHWHLDMAWGGDDIGIEFGPFTLYIETLGFEGSTVLNFILRIENVGIEIVVHSKEYHSRCTFALETVDFQADMWMKNIEDTIMQWNEIITGGGRSERVNEDSRITG